MNTSPILLCSLLLGSFFTAERSMAKDAPSPDGRAIAPSSAGIPQPTLPRGSFAGGCVTNLVINGDFERNAAAGCDFNLSNAAFAAEVSSVTAFGTAEEIDVMKDPNGCGYDGPPYSGETKVAIHRQSVPNGPFDAFSFDLLFPVVAGQRYHLEFFAVADMLSEPDKGSVEVGISTTPDDFGTLIATGFPDAGSWHQFAFDITAPISGSYLTVREGDFLAWDHIDAFSLVPLDGSTAGWTTYGAGWPGTQGVPSLTSSGPPLLCTQIAISVGNSRGATTPAAFLVGFSRASVPTGSGGTLLVLPSAVVPFVLPAGGASVPYSVLCGGQYCGLVVDLQVLEVDPGASLGVSFTPGLELVHGT